MLLINISSDQILFSGEGIHEILPYEDLERTFPKRFLEIIKQYSVTKVAVINGPGSFTSLRIGSIGINTYNNLMHESGKLSILDISKLGMIEYAQSKSLLPDKSIIFMGMRKKMWGMSHGKPPREVSQETVEDFISGDDYFVDWIVDHPVLENLDSNKFISEIRYVSEGLQLHFGSNKIVLDREKIGTWVDELQPRYMMEPTLN